MLVVGRRDEVPERETDTDSLRPAMHRAAGWGCRGWGGAGRRVPVLELERGTATYNVSCLTSLNRTNASVAQFTSSAFDHIKKYMKADTLNL